MWEIYKIISSCMSLKNSWKEKKKTYENQTTVLMRNIPVLYKVQILFFTDNYLAHLNTLSLSLKRRVLIIEWAVSRCISIFSSNYYNTHFIISGNSGAWNICLCPYPKEALRGTNWRGPLPLGLFCWADLYNWNHKVQNVREYRIQHCVSHWFYLVLLTKMLMLIYSAKSSVKMIHIYFKSFLMRIYRYMHMYLNFKN